MTNDKIQAGEAGAPSPARHGVNCPKAPHGAGGFLHLPEDDGPYDVDGVKYCGRCHSWLGIQAVNADGEPLHTGDDARIDLVSSIIASAEELEGNEEITDIAASIIDDCHKLDALLVAELRAAGRGVPEASVCGVVGHPEAGRRVCELFFGHEGYHQQGNVRWLGYHPVVPDAPLEPTRKPCPSCGEGMMTLKWHCGNIACDEIQLAAAVPAALRAPREPIDNGNIFVFCDFVDTSQPGSLAPIGCCRGMGHNGPHAFAPGAKLLLAPVLLRAAADAAPRPASAKPDSILELD